jgi:co-chaperonin GroES (HSP10)
MALKMMGHRILIKPDPVKEQTKLPEALRDLKFEVAKSVDQQRQEEVATTIGTIVSIGKMAWRAFDGTHPDWEPWCKVGDRVIFAKYGGKLIEDPVTLEKFMVLNDEDIYAKVEGEKSPWE